MGVACNVCRKPNPICVADRVDAASRSTIAHVLFPLGFRETYGNRWGAARLSDLVDSGSIRNDHGAMGGAMASCCESNWKDA